MTGTAEPHDFKNSESGFKDYNGLKDDKQHRYSESFHIRNPPDD
jgi:hypothetical protein